VVRALTSIPGVAYAVPRVAYNSDGGVVNVYIGDLDGSGNPALTALAQEELDRVIALGILATAFSAVRKDYRLTLTCYVPGNVDRAQADAQIRAGVLNYTNNVSIGDSVFESEIHRAAHNAYTKLIRVTTTTNGAVFDTIDPPDDISTLRLDTADLTIKFVPVNET
jgi:hypothetical protein